jgi:hypothetical protein
MNPQSRADFGKAHVIISEKRDKKAAKYLTKDLPYPYTSKAQFERSLETPIGREWNTRIVSQRATMPKVTKKVRFIIFAINTHQRLTNNHIQLIAFRWVRSSDHSRSDSSLVPHYYLSLRIFLRGLILDKSTVQYNISADQ